MESIVNEWFMLICYTALVGTTILVNMIVGRKIKRLYPIRKEIRWLLWICPKEINQLALLDYFLIIVFEILLGVEVIGEGYFLVICDVEKAEGFGSWIALIMFIIFCFIAIYVTIFSCYYGKRNYFNKEYREFDIKKSVADTGKVVIGGGGIFRRFFMSLLVLGTIVLGLIMEQLSMQLQDGNIQVNCIITGLVILLFLIWIILIQNRKLQVMVLEEGKFIYRNWYGKSDSCLAKDIAKIESGGVYIFMWISREQLFAKFNTCTEGLEMILESRL